jgi:light-regulated signal transduction histidine kinase (bacteriophytochrome)
VEDNGIGFDEKYADRIFGAFQRLHGREAYEGTGIGLSIARKIAWRHDGDITATSVVGEGATFHLTLPVAPPGTTVLAASTSDVQSERSAA